jgi:hypothetical protein
MSMGKPIEKVREIRDQIRRNVEKMITERVRERRG